MIQPLPRSTNIPVSNPDAGLKLTEIFYSLQGEGLTAGLPTVFVRLTGCPLRCVYCDTEYAFHGGTRHALEDIVNAIGQYQCRRICVTGGEPLAQPNCIPLLTRLVEQGFEVSLETAGALSVAKVPEAVSKVMDIKTPSSGECDKNNWSNLDHLTTHDQLKFVIMNRQDYEWARQHVATYKLDTLVDTVWFSPMFAVNETAIDDPVTTPILAQQLAEWILADHLPVRLQLQLHKLIWADAQGK